METGVCVSSSDLRALVESVVTGVVITEKAFGRFNLRLFKSLKTPGERIGYARKSGLREMGEGSSRITFAINSSKILKISTQNSGQNKQEVEAYLKYQDQSGDAFAEIYDYEAPGQKLGDGSLARGYGWLIVEPVQGWDTSGYDERFSSGKMEQITGGITPHVLYEIAPVVRRQKLKTPEEAIQSVLNHFQSRIEHEKQEMLQNPTGSHRSKSLIRQYMGNVDVMSYLKRKITPVGREMLQKFINLTALGFNDIDRPDHWGLTVRGRVVCLDYGIQDFHHLTNSEY